MQSTTRTASIIITDKASDAETFFIKRCHTESPLTP